MENDIPTQLTRIEQRLEHFSQQRKNFQNQLLDTQVGIKELESAKENYKIIGNIMVKRDANVTKKELEEKQEMLNIRIKSIEKQEEKLHEQTKELQTQMLKGSDHNG